MRLLMSRVEDGVVPGPGLSVAETVFTFVVIPVALFALIALLSWAISAPRKEKPQSSVSSIN
jgi:hypothetical protein|uniref:hypothetical protein n=1 Tax=Candidatus Planktophila sp. TaxID=2175601 RepID=UPI00404A7A7E